MTSATDVEHLPPAYYQMLCPPSAEPGFNDERELRERWGAAWGSHDEVGVLRVVLMRAPGAEFERIDARHYDPRVDALVDPDGGWYWTGDRAPDLGRLAEQHAGLRATLEREGVEVVLAESIAPRFPKAIYTRDPLVSVPGGVVIGRLAPLMRRGEEASISRAVVNRGAPILRTIVGTGMVEGGSLVKLNATTAAYGTSIRCNEEGAEQLRETLRWLGVELIVVPMTGFAIHLDGRLGMVDVDKALVDANGLPYWFLARLQQLEIEPIWVDPEERWAINCLAVAPGRVVITDDCPKAIAALERRGVEVIPIPYDEIQHNGGGIHCSTMELLREPA
ncbi:MAG: arginine deiminase family protein [Solirubrobacteraceae bacterium]